MITSITTHLGVDYPCDSSVRRNCRAKWQSKGSQWNDSIIGRRRWNTAKTLNSHLTARLRAQIEFLQTTEYPIVKLIAASNDAHK